MLVKAFAIALLAGTVLRLVLGARWQDGIGRWFHRVVDTALIVLAFCLVLQLVLIAIK